MKKNTMRNIGMPALMIAAGSALAIVGCSESTGPAEHGQELKGVVRWFESGNTLTGAPSWPEDATIVIEAPDVVQKGAPFEAVVRTLGNSGCWEVARTDVENGPALAEVTPVDRDRITEGIACTAIRHCFGGPDRADRQSRCEAGAMVQLVHELELTFTEVGEALIRVRGREVVGNDFHSGEDVTIEKVVMVVE